MIVSSLLNLSVFPVLLQQQSFLNPQNFREMIPLLGVFRILTIVILGKLQFIIGIILLLQMAPFRHLFPFLVGTDFGFAFYRRFAAEETGLKVQPTCAAAENQIEKEPNWDLANL